jgi:hypothetical protein
LNLLMSCLGSPAPSPSYSNSFTAGQNRRPARYLSGTSDT